MNFCYAYSLVAVNKLVHAVSSELRVGPQKINSDVRNDTGPLFASDFRDTLPVNWEANTMTECREL